MLKSSFVVIFCIGLLNQYAYCNRNAWWNNLMTKVEARQNNQWTTIGNTEVGDIAAQTTNRSVKRSNLVAANDEVTDSPARQRSKSWEKTYARRHSYKSDWVDGQPLRERYVETEWDDDVPVRHVLRDSGIDEEKRDRKGDGEQYEKTSRQSFRDEWIDNVDNGEVVRPVKEAYNSARNNNNNNKPKAITNSWDSRAQDSRAQQPKPDRLVTHITFDNREEDKKAANDKWNKLAETIFNNNKNERQTFRDPDQLVKPIKPKFTVVFETTTPKPEKLISAKSSGDQKKNENPKNSGQTATQRFGWRSSINHSNNGNNEINANNANNANNVNNLDRPSTKPRTTTVSFTDITTTSRPTDYTTFTTTTRAKPKAPKPSTNTLTESLAPNKKQHRMGSWVESDVAFNDQEDDDWVDNPSRTQPLVEEEYDDEQLPERVEAVPQPQPQVQQNARQVEKQKTAESVDYDEPKNWRLEDALPGSPGTDYPTYAKVPKTSFDCKNHEWPGYYADVEAQCQVFHICQAGGRKDSFLCPNGTMFNQKAFVCDWWHNVQCNEVADHYPLNANIYDYNWESKRTKTPETQGAPREIRRSGTVEETVEPLTPSRNAETTTEATESEADSSEVEDPTERTNNNESPEELPDEESENEKLSKLARIRSPVVRYKTTRYSAHSSRSKRGDYLRI